MPQTTTRSGGAFTLVELLVVIGVIAVLIGLLLPVLSRVSEHARRLQCMSNLRQLSWAILAYANENQGWFPASATGFARLDHDWLYWQSSNPPRDLQQSKIARYLSRPLNTSILLCPSDQVASQRKSNWYFVSDVGYPFSYSTSPEVLGDPHLNIPPKKLGSVRRSSEQVMIAEESEKTINDGLFAYKNHAPMWDLLSIRHDRRAADPETPPRDLPMQDLPLPNPKRRGNVSFVDGHVDFVPRESVHGKDQNIMLE